jgi:hypothetical protein
LVWRYSAALVITGGIEKMKKTFRFALLCTVGICLAIAVGVLAAQQPGDSNRSSSQNGYQSQEAHDAVQDRKLDELEEWRKGEMFLMQEVRDNQKLETGGLWGFGAVLTLLQIMQLRKGRDVK